MTGLSVRVWCGPHTAVDVNKARELVRTYPVAWSEVDLDKGYFTLTDRSHSLLDKVVQEILTTCLKDSAA